MDDFGDYTRNRTQTLRWVRFLILEDIYMSLNGATSAGPEEISSRNLKYIFEIRY